MELLEKDKAQKKQDAGSGEAPATDGLMSEVTSLLKSLRVATQGGPQIRAYRLRSAGLGEGLGRVLLDGGATHCLRTTKLLERMGGECTSTSAVGFGTG